MKIKFIASILTTILACMLCATTTFGAEPNNNEIPESNPETSYESADLCIKARNCDNLETRSNRKACRSNCSQFEPEKKQEYLPPIAKPTNLPGPVFSDPNKRTGQEATTYITEKLLPKVAARMITVIAVASMLGLVFSGIQFYTAMGESDKMQKARRAAVFSVIGLVLALLSFTIVQIINLLPLST